MINYSLTVWSKVLTVTFPPSLIPSLFQGRSAGTLTRAIAQISMARRSFG
jgi:hypothetical protein